MINGERSGWGMRGTSPIQETKETPVILLHQKNRKVVVLLVSTFWWLAEDFFFFFKNSQGPPAVEDAGFETALWNPALSSLGSQLTIPWYPFEKRTFLKENDTPIFLTAVLSSATVYPSIHWIRSEYRVERPAVDQTDALNHTRTV